MEIHYNIPLNTANHGEIFSSTCGWDRVIMEFLTPAKSKLHLSKYCLQLTVNSECEIARITAEVILQVKSVYSTI